MNVLALNCGSSSLKYAVFDDDQEVVRGAIEGVADHGVAVRSMFDALDDGKVARPQAVGHRLVPRGPKHLEPARVDDALLASLRDAVPFAPLHLPMELRAIDAVRERYADVPQVACFDTSFHRTLSEVARRFALPKALEAAGIWRYGFHGLSYRVTWVEETLGAESLGRAVIAHLGNGASMVAVRDGESVDTTMGLTPTAGLVMGTRSGDLDPGLLVYLLDHCGYDARSPRSPREPRGRICSLLSGTTSDMKKPARAPHQRPSWRRSPSPCSVIAHEDGSVPSPRRSEASTTSSSPEASASTHPRSATRSAPGSSTSASVDGALSAWWRPTSSVQIAAGTPAAFLRDVSRLLRGARALHSPRGDCVARRDRAGYAARIRATHDHHPGSSALRARSSRRGSDRAHRPLSAPTPVAVSGQVLDDAVAPRRALHAQPGRPRVRRPVQPPRGIEASCIAATTWTLRRPPRGHASPTSCAAASSASVRTPRSNRSERCCSNRTRPLTPFGPFPSSTPRHDPSGWCRARTCCVMESSTGWRAT